MSQVVASASSTSITGAGLVPRILIVDDEPYMCDICARTLQRGGYDIVATSDTQVAVRALRSEGRFDLLLTDIKMPTMSGLDLAHLAREHNPTIAIIIMTGFATMENIQQSVQSGIADFLSKPFELEHLRLAVDQALHKRSILQDNLRLQAITRLLESSQALSATLELTEVANLLLRVSLGQSECRAGFLLLKDEHGGLATTVPSTAGGELLSSGSQLAARAIEQQQTVLSHDMACCVVDGEELREALAVPLRAQGQIHGVLLLCDDRPDTLRPGIQESVTLLANHAGAALRNAVLYGELDKAYQHAQELDRLKSEFISIASHELRTPLSIVLGYTMMVRDQTENEQRLYLERVMESAQRIKDIVDDMVSLRHLDTGEAQFALEQVSIQDVIRTAAERIQPAAHARKQTLEVVLPEEATQFFCDHEKVLLILGHLLSNAVRFTPEHGHITVRGALQSAAAPPDEQLQKVLPLGAVPLEWVIIEVQDTGIGIPEREQPRIFERFYQVASSLTRDHGGTGLGLALVRELVSLLDGAVWVTSAEGAGSTFSLALPYRQQPPSNGQANDAEHYA